MTLTTRTTRAVFGGVTLKDCIVVVSLQPALISVSGPVCAPAGTLTRISVPVLALGEAVAPPPKRAWVTPMKLVPVIVIGAPTGPLFGLKSAMVGQAGCVLTPSPRN